MSHARDIKAVIAETQLAKAQIIGHLLEQLTPDERKRVDIVENQGNPSYSVVMLDGEAIGGAVMTWTDKGVTVEEIAE